MENRYIVVAMLLFSIAGTSVANAALVGSASINAPAVILYNNSGSITKISVNVSTGNGTVGFSEPANVADSTLASAYTAAEYAAQYAGVNFSRYDFTYAIMDNGANVSGPSAGAAMSIIAIAAIEHVHLRNDFTITGTVSSDGSIGEIGGVVDKVGAAAGDKLRFVLVPYAGSAMESSLYLIAQDEYNIPVVQVRSVAQALAYATNSSFTGIGNETKVELVGNYSMASLPAANVSCSNGCSIGPFGNLTRYTISEAQGSIGVLAASPLFSGVVSQLRSAEGQSMSLFTRGYYYTAADISFINLINADYFGSYNASRGGALASMRSVQAYCGNLTAPNLTRSNYEYIINGELRQLWGNYTINSTLSAYNESGVTTDGVLTGLYQSGEAGGWCGAAQFLYNYSYTGNATQLDMSAALGRLAERRVAEASAYPGMYYATAQQAYARGEYGAAILDADYAIVFSNSIGMNGKNVSTLDSEAEAMARNATYGAWPSEFAKEAMFYVYQSGVSNSSNAMLYAQQAYEIAELAQRMSLDTRLISQNTTAAPESETAVMAQLSQRLAVLTGEVQVLIMLVLLLTAVLVIVVGFVAMQLQRLSRIEKGVARGAGRKRR